MKFRYLALVFAAVLMVIAASRAASPQASHENPEIDHSHLLQRLETEILNRSLVGKSVYVSPRILRRGDTVTAWQRKHRVPSGFSDTILVFIDEHPEANWEHPATYVFIDRASGRYSVEAGRTPPDDLASFQRLE